MTSGGGAPVGGDTVLCVRKIVRIIFASELWRIRNAYNTNVYLPNGSGIEWNGKFGMVRMTRLDDSTTQYSQSVTHMGSFDYIGDYRMNGEHCEHGMASLHIVRDANKCVFFGRADFPAFGKLSTTCSSWIKRQKGYAEIWAFDTLPHSTQHTYILTHSHTRTHTRARNGLAAICHICVNIDIMVWLSRILNTHTLFQHIVRLAHTPPLSLSSSSTSRSSLL